MKNILFAAMVLAVLAGCSTTPTEAPVEDKSATAAPTTPSTGASTAGTSTAGVSGATGSGADPRKDPSNILYKRSVFFEFDSFVVDPQYKPIIEAHAKYLVANPTAKVTLQGHADERGSREYNIALGQKRADAVKRMMTLLGVRETIVESVSFGEEKPKNMGHDEGAWAENRRVDIIYVGE